MIDINKFIPALPPCLTPKDCSSVDQSCQKGSCKVAVPYAFDATPWAHIPALSTERYAFWITNPSMAMFYAVNRYCNGWQGVTAYVVESSYSSIQVWRFDPYEFCPMVNGVRKCPADTTATYRTLPGFVVGDFDANRVCTQQFNVVAPSITYVNEYNVALTVLYTSFMNVDTDTLRPFDASKARCNFRGFGGFLSYHSLFLVLEGYGGAFDFLKQKLNLLVSGGCVEGFRYLARTHEVYQLQRVGDDCKAHGVGENSGPYIRVGFKALVARKTGELRCAGDQFHAQGHGYEECLHHKRVSCESFENSAENYDDG
jgi:hypothetical protein